MLHAVAVTAGCGCVPGGACQQGVTAAGEAGSQTRRLLLSAKPGHTPRVRQQHATQQGVRCHWQIEAFMAASSPLESTLLHWLRRHRASNLMKALRSDVAMDGRRLSSNQVLLYCTGSMRGGATPEPAADWQIAAVVLRQCGRCATHPAPLPCQCHPPRWLSSS